MTYEEQRAAWRADIRRRYAPDHTGGYLPTTRSTTMTTPTAAAYAVTPIVARDALGWALLTIGPDNARALARTAATPEEAETYLREQLIPHVKGQTRYYDADGNRIEVA